VWWGRLKELGLIRSVIPVVVARCGLYLKETATEVEGAFRISGSAKRMRDLQEVFDTPPRVRISFHSLGRDERRYDCHLVTDNRPVEVHYGVAVMTRTRGGDRVDADQQYGKDIKWDDQSYTPHDVATIFRR
jgi:hypothetical protein